ncbi:hypothetical protein AC579_4665 [Pseudocercospora musae]|uniref:Uncharacterized protein n=1 Tax=Pseudocercospora musae TaxID=113226 RepID=A0A139IBJ3_9PEZI|nr:hypothetical protein AC579_4665 [Pseudocercospora musae]
MVKIWKQHGAVNENRLKNIVLHIDRAMADCTEGERAILQGPMRAIFNDVKQFEYMLEEEAAEELDAVRKTTAEAKAATAEKHDLDTDPPTHTTARTPTEVLNDQESLQLLMAVNDHWNSSPSKKPVVLTKKWTFGPVTVYFSSLQRHKNDGDAAADIKTWIFILLVLVLVLTQVY